MYSFCPSLVWSSPWEVVQHPAQQKSEQMGSRAACVSLCPHLSPLAGDEILPLELREGSSPCCPWGAPQFEEKCFMAGRVRLLTQHCTSHPPGAPLGREHQAAQLLCKWDLTISWMWIAPLHIGVDYIPCHFDFNLRAMLNSFLYSASTKCMFKACSHLQRGPMAMAEPYSCVFFRCLLAVIPV